MDDWRSKGIFEDWMIEGSISNKWIIHNIT